MKKCLLRLLPSLVALAACSQGGERGAVKPADDPPSDSTEIVTPRGTLPPFNSPDRYVGVWAAAETACGHAAWRIERDRLQSPAWMACDFEKVTPAQDGFTIEAQCTDGAREHNAEIRLSFAESAQAMLMRGVPETGDVGLIYCSPIDAAP